MSAWSYPASGSQHLRKLLAFVRLACLLGGVERLARVLVGLLRAFHLGQPLGLARRGQRSLRR